jgi:signal transduction histidine kinase
MMGGTIAVRSERGVGTSFTIEIPVARPCAGAGASSVKSAA